MKYRDLIQFEPVEDIIQLRTADRFEEAKKLVETYVISDLMADKLTEVIFKHLQYEMPFDTKEMCIRDRYWYLPPLSSRSPWSLKWKTIFIGRSKMVLSQSLTPITG